MPDAIDIVLRVARRDAELARQDRTHLHEHARVRIVAVGNLRHRKPAQQADRPGGRECGPATLPDRMQRDAQFVVESVHARTFQNMLSGMMITSPGSSRTLARVLPFLSRSESLSADRKSTRLNSSH